MDDQMTVRTQNAAQFAQPLIQRRPVDVRKEVKRVRKVDTGVRNVAESGVHDRHRSQVRPGTQAMSDCSKCLCATIGHDQRLHRSDHPLGPLTLARTDFEGGHPGTDMRGEELVDQRFPPERKWLRGTLRLAPGGLVKPTCSDEVAPLATSALDTWHESPQLCRGSGDAALGHLL